MNNTPASSAPSSLAPSSLALCSEQDTWLKAATEAAVLAGKILQDWRGRFQVREKSRANLVTEADEASQRAIVEHLQSQFPDHGFLGEEALLTPDHQQLGSWIIDPLDGTSNYVHGFPYYCVSIAFHRQGQLQVGVIFDPNRNECFTAIAGRGANLNGIPIQTSGETELGKTMAMASLPIAPDPAHPMIQKFLKALPRLQTVQRSGSAALNLAYVASGRIDAFWSGSLHPWDVAAGALIVQEAGGTVTNMTGGPNDIFVPSLLAASSPQLSQEVVTVLS